MISIDYFYDIEKRRGMERLIRKLEMVILSNSISIKFLFVLFFLLFISLDSGAQKKLKRGALSKIKNQTTKKTRSIGFFQADIFVINRFDLAVGYFINPNGSTIMGNADYFVRSDFVIEASIIIRKEDFLQISVNRTGALLGGKYILVKSGALALSGGLGFLALQQKLNGIKSDFEISPFAVGSYFSSELWIHFKGGFSTIIRTDIMLLNQRQKIRKFLTLNHYGVLFRKNF